MDEFIRKIETIFALKNAKKQLPTFCAGVALSLIGDVDFLPKT